MDIGGWSISTSKSQETTGLPPIGAHISSPLPVGSTAVSVRVTVLPGTAAAGAGLPSWAVTLGWWSWPCSSRMEKAPGLSGGAPVVPASVSVKVHGVVAGTGNWPSSGTAGPTAVARAWPPGRTTRTVSPSTASHGWAGLAAAIRPTGEERGAPREPGWSARLTRRGGAVLNRYPAARAVSWSAGRRGRI